MSEEKAKLEEDDLDDLDDYLDDFADDILSKPPGFDLDSSNNQNGGSVTSETETMKESRPETTATASEEDAIAELLKKMEQESPEARNQLQDLINEVNSLDAPSSQAPDEHKTKDGNLKDTISSTLNRLKQSGSKVDKSIKDEQPDQMLQELLSQMNLDGDGGEGTDDFDITKLLADMLDNLASKEILYDPLKDLSSKYPKWIEEHKKEVSEDDLARYVKQSEIVQSIVAKFEDENYSDSNKEHRKFINDKLEEMQNCGNPPPDLTGDLEQSRLPGFNFNSGDLPDNMDKELEEGCAQS